MELLTPFEYTMVDYPAVEDIEGPEYNYTPLDLFTLRMKISYVLQGMYGPLSVVFKSIPFEKRMRIAVTTNPKVIREDDVIPLTEIIQKSFRESRYRAIILDLGKNLIWKKSFVPVWWINIMIPRIHLKDTLYGPDYMFLDLSAYIDYPIDEQFNLESYDASMEKGRPDFQTYYYETQTKIINILHYMYNQGYRYLSSPEGEGKEKAPSIEGWDIDLTDIYILSK